MSSSFPVSIRFQVEGDADVQNKLRGLNQGVQQTGQSANQATGPVGKLTKGVQQTGQAAQQSAQQHVSLGQRIQNSAAGFSLAASSAVALWAAYDNVTDAAKQVEIAEDKVTQTRTRLIQAQERLVNMQRQGADLTQRLAQEQAKLAEMQADGSTTAEELAAQQEKVNDLQDKAQKHASDYALQQRKVEDATNRLEAAEFRLTNAQEDLNKTWVQSATSVVPSMFTGITGLGMAFKGLAPQMKSASDAGGMGRGGFGGAMRLLISPLGIIVGIIAGVGAAIWALRTNFMGVRDAARGFIDWLKEVTNAIPFARQAIDWLVNGYKWLEDTLFGVLGNLPIVGDMFTNLSDKQKGAANATELLRNGFNTLRDALTNLPGQIAELARSLWDGLRNTARGIYEQFTSGEFQRQAEAGIRWLFEQVSTTLGPIGETLWNGLVNTATWIVTTLQDPEFQTQFLQGLRAFADGVQGLYTQIGQVLWNGLVDTAVWIYNTLTNSEFLNQFGQGVIEFVARAAEWIRNNLQPIGERIWGALVETANWIYTTLTSPEFHQTIVGALTDLFNAAKDWLAKNALPIGQRLWAELVSAGQALYDVIKNEFVPWAQQGLSYLFGRINAFLQENIPLVKDYLYNGLVTAGQGLYSALLALGPVVQSGLNWLGSQLQPFFENSIVPFANYLTSGGLREDVGVPLENAIRALPSQISTAWENYDEEFGAALGTALGTGAVWLIDAINASITGLPEKLTTLGNQIGNAIGGALTAGLGNPAAIPAAAAKLPGQIQEAITSQDFGSGFAKAFSDAFVAQGGPKALEALVTSSNSLMAWIKDGIAAIPNLIVEDFRNKASIIAAAFGGGIRAAVGQAAQALKDAIIGGTNSLLAHIKTGITGLPKAIGDAIKGLDIKAVSDGFVEFLKKFNPADAITKAWGNFSDWLSGWITPTGGGGGGGQPTISPASIRTPGVGQGQMPWLQNDMGGGGLAMGSPDNTSNIFKPLIDALNQLKSAFGFSPIGMGGGGGGGGGGIFASIGTSLQALRGQFTQFAQQATTAITGVTVAWTGHATAVGNIINLVGQHIGRLVQGYNLLIVAVQTAITQMAVGWAGHSGAIGSMINAVGQQLGRLVQGYNLLLQGVQTAITQMAVAWNGHAQAVGGMVNRTGQQLGKLVQGYNLLVQAVARGISQMTGLWSQHAGQVSGLVNRIGQQLGRLVQGYNLLVRGVQQGMNQMNNLWRQHANTVSSAVNNASSRVRSLASAVRSSMNTISSSMRTATSAANNLRAAISRLQSRNITVTTRYRTIGTPTARAARGFSGVVSQPTRLFVGEGNKPEMVTVTPLKKSGGNVSMNKAAQGVTHMFQQPTIRAGGSTGNITGSKTAPVSQFSGTIPQLGKFRKIVADTIEDWVDNFGYELNKFTSNFKGAGNILFEIAGGKHFDRITAQQAMNFSRGRGYSLRAYLSRKSGSNLTMRMDKGDIPGTAGPGTGGGGVGGLGLGIFTGADLMRALKYVTNAPNLNKPLHSMHLFTNGTGKLFYQDGSMDWIRHAHPGAFGGATTIKGALGYSGIVSSPTRFMAGEGGRAEMVNIQPLSQRMSGGRGVGGGGRGMGRPVIVQLNIKSELDGRVISEVIRKELLGGIYSMS